MDTDSDQVVKAVCDAFVAFVTEAPHTVHFRGVSVDEIARALAWSAGRVRRALGEQPRNQSVWTACGGLVRGGRVLSGRRAKTGFGGLRDIFVAYFRPTQSGFASQVAAYDEATINVANAWFAAVQADRLAKRSREIERAAQRSVACRVEGAPAAATDSELLTALDYERRPALVDELIARFRRMI